MTRKQRFIQAMIDIANDDSHGYAQDARWGPDYDCSSMVYTAAYIAGYNVSRQDPRYTGTIIEDFVPAGFSCRVYDGLEHVKPGDILLRDEHVAVAIGGGKLAEASINSWGGITGDTPGDQTGWEIHITNLYGGWNYILTPPTEESMAYEIKQNLTNTNYDSRGTNPSWIVIHNTANGTSKEGTAWANTNYFKNEFRSASAHYFVDDGNTIWQCVRDTDTAWHVGDSSSRNGCTNYNSIGIETCERADGSFSEHEISVLSWLVPMLMNKYGIDANHVCRHHDVTGKICPAGYIDNGRWSELKARIISGEEAPEVITEEDLDRIADRVWGKMYGEASYGQRLYGTDQAANGLYNEWKNYGIARTVWDYNIDKTPAWARMVGIDRASNGAKNACDEYLPKIYKNTEK